MTDRVGDMSYREQRTPIQPPEIQHPQDPITLHTFYVDLGTVQPEVDALRMAADWLAKQPPTAVLNLGVAYLPETAIEPPMFELTLVLACPVDLG